ncbi:MAG TPA: hypothetical protein VFN30_01690 [Chitinophagaceae bacterium]|nr:hypothetical protein [Chitinophagaceae bacterium]
MKISFKPKAVAAFSVLFTLFTSSSYPQSLIYKNKSPKIQVAILLDVSNSMDGLIAQAKSQLWNMVNILGRAKCNGITPEIEIALYEYGTPRNDARKGYVRQINGFCRDLDQVSKNLFALTTNGGDEYCGHVMYSSLTEMQWDTSIKSYKVIFIAGNEDFLQGDVAFTKACNEAKKRGVIVNTIYCGDRIQGIQEHWNLGSECGNGSYTNINQDAKEDDIPTPYDTELIALNNKLNDTYITYGYAGSANLAKQAEVDKMNFADSKKTAAKRIAVKGQSGLYKNSSWDLVDAGDEDSTVIAKVDKKYLPDSLRKKSTKELQAIVLKKKQERSFIQNKIEATVASREKYILEEKRKNRSANNNAPTLESEIEKIIRGQVKRFGMEIK